MNDFMDSTQDLGLEQRVALRTAASRLMDQFGGTFNPETIERFLYSSYDDFAGRATVMTLLKSNLCPNR